jgi:hypothetical protein
MSSLALTHSTRRPASSSAGASPTPFIKQWALDQFHHDRTGTTSFYEHHAYLPPVCGTPGGPTVFLGFHLFGTSDRIELSEEVQTRMFCHALVHWLPDRALAEAAESLSDMYTFYSTPVPQRLPLPHIASVPVEVGPTVVRPVFPLSEE